MGILIAILWYVFLVNLFLSGLVEAIWAFWVGAIVGIAYYFGEQYVQRKLDKHNYLRR